MRRDHPTTPFDVQAEEADDVTREFWGTSRGWVAREHPTTEQPADGSHPDHSTRPFWNDDTTGSLRALRDGVRAFRPQRVSRHTTGQVERTRQHHIVGVGHDDLHDDLIVDGRQASAPRRLATSEATLGQLAAGWVDDDPDTIENDDEPTAASTVQPRPRADDRDLVPLSPVQPLADRLGLSAVDPLLLRIGMLILVTVMLVPVALALRPAAGGVIEGAPAEGAQVETTVPDLVAAAAAAGVTGVVSSDGGPGQQPSATDPAVATATGGSTLAGDTAPPVTAQATATQGAASPSSEAPDRAVGDVTQDVPLSGGQSATVSATAERQEPECPSTYVTGAGDSWYRIADEAGVTPTELLDQNLASVDSVIFPGDEICLPAGAKMPSQPVVTTEAPATTKVPVTTEAPVTTSPAPATTAPPTTQPAPPPAPASTDEVQRLIREVWPDELEEQALQIAWRESNYQPGVYNGWCCYGVFQIYWTVHRSWLDDYDITSSNDLLDARKNIEAAYVLYQRSGSFRPWGG